MDAIYFKPDFLKILHFWFIISGDRKVFDLFQLNWSFSKKP